VGWRTIGAALVMTAGVVLMILGYGKAPGTLPVAGLLVTGAGVVWGVVNLIGGAPGGTSAGR
jgi:hypothetical protein